MDAINEKKTIIKPSKIASKIPTHGSGRDSGTHSRSSSVSNITTASDIHSEMGDGSSESIEDFKIDEKVFVNGTKSGIIKFLGKTEFAPGVWAGILLDEPVGKNDGSVGGVKYFTCDPLRGIFARPNKLSRTLGALSTGIGDTASGGLVTPKSTRGIPSSRASVCSNASATSTRTCSRLRVGERITVSSLGGEKPGTLRFIGETDFAKGEWAGIELDEPTGKNDGSVAGKKYFTCPMKYGLFAPIHKISRAGGTGTTPLSRPASARGIPLRRSTSRDSLSSSVSNCSKASRVKLGVTSLSSAQKPRTSGGGIMTTSKALQEALKEKDQHVEQLLKERDLDRAEIAKVTSHFKEFEKISIEWESKLQKTIADKKGLEDQLVDVQSKLEDIQFQLEEEKICKSDFEMQLQQRSQTLKRIEDFISKDPGDRFLNIMEILAGVDTLSEVGDREPLTPEAEELRKKISLLETSLQQLSNEKEEISNQCKELQSSFGDALEKNKCQIEALQTSVQEKEDIISHLKSELNQNIEKVTHITEDNKNLNEQMLLQEKEAKERADEMIKELGETVKSLKEEISAKSNQANLHIEMMQDKDNKISALEQSLADQASTLFKNQEELNNVTTALRQKETEIIEKSNAKKLLEESILALKSQVNSDNNEKEEKINLLEQEIKTKSNQINEFLTSLQEKENAMKLLQENFDVQFNTLSELRNDLNTKCDIIKSKESELESKAIEEKVLKEKVVDLQAMSDSSISEKEQKMLELVKEIERLTNTVQSKDDQLAESETKFKESQKSIELLNLTILELQGKIKEVESNCSEIQNIASIKTQSLQNELSSLELEKAQRLGNAEVEIQDLKNVIEKKNQELDEKSKTVDVQKSEIVLLTEKSTEYQDELLKMKANFNNLAENNECLIKEKNSLEISLKEKDEATANYDKQVEDLRIVLEKFQIDVEEKEKKISSFKSELNASKEENNQLSSKLQLAEQNVEMLNKDSSEHVMSLQNELSKLKEESITTKLHLEQELTKMKSENKKLFDVVSEKEELLGESNKSLTLLENKMKEQDAQLSCLSDEKEQFTKEVAKLSLELEIDQKQKQDSLENMQAEFSSKLADKEKELETAKISSEKLCQDLKEKEKSMLNMESLIKSLQVKLQDKEEELCNLATQNSELIASVAKFSADIEELNRISKDNLNSSMLEHDSVLKEKEQIIQDVQSQLAEKSSMLNIKSNELQDKENEIGTLQSVIQNTEAQVDELSKKLEESESQLLKLKENYEKNQSLEQMKEESRNKTITELEKELQLLHQGHKEEISKLQSVLQSKDSEVHQKELTLNKTVMEIEQHRKLVESLQSQLDIANAKNQKLVDDSSNVCLDLKKEIESLEAKCSQLLEEKTKIIDEESKTKEALRNLELVHDSLIQEKSAQEAVVKDRDSKLESLHAEVNRMKGEFAQQKQDLQQKLNVSQTELEAVKEFKTELESQHSLCGKLQNQIQLGEKRIVELEAQLQTLLALTQEKNTLQAEVEEFKKLNKEKSEMISLLQTQNLTLEEQLNNNKNDVLLKDKDLMSLKEQLSKTSDEKSIKSAIKALEEENKSLKNKISSLELLKSEKPVTAAVSGGKDLSAEESEERESLLSQIDFLNSIIVDMKTKNEELTRELELQRTCWDDDTDVNLNETLTKALAPRLFCDICDMFDLHETCDCPKQESFVEEEIPHLRKAGSKPLEERPYCNNCEVFGHWTLDCTEEQEF